MKRTDVKVHYGSHFSMANGNMGLFFIELVICALNFNPVNSTTYDLSLALINEGEDVIANIDTGCPLGYFECNETDSNLCLAQRKMCNGIVDCMDGTDEMDCEDHLKNLFFDHSYRKNPVALLDDVFIGECAWEQTIDLTQCDCKGYDISCHKKNLTKLPSHLPTDGIGRLNLAENQYWVINKHFFDTLPEVELLILKHCSIREIFSDAFKVLSNIDLHTIYLNQNQIASLPERFFPPGNRLERLILDGNFIAELPTASFANLIHLVELDLRDNCILSFNAATFEQMPNLEVLNLNNNRIKALTINMIPKLSNLLTLNLEQNYIEFIENFALTLPSLENLYLQNNKIQQLINDTFSNLPKLKSLFLNDNEIERIQLASFYGIENLPVNIDGVS